MEPNDTPTPGTRFTYTVFNETFYAKDRTISEQWSGTVVRSFVCELGDLAVVIIRDDNGVTEIFWNDSWNLPSIYESIEVHR
jgi:hypothetical protein